MIDAWIGNLGKYNEGEPIGEWVKFPTTPEHLQEVFDRIGIDNVQYEEWYLAAWQSENVPNIQGFIGEYSNLEEINYLAALFEDLEYYGDLEGYNLVADDLAFNLKTLST